MNAVKRFLSMFISLAILLSFAVPVSAQQTVISSPTVNVRTCANITMTLKYGDRDIAGTQVSILQDFLHRNGYLAVSPTGYFGPLTLRAVKAFQLKSAAGAVDGIVGPQTQAHIRAFDCLNGTINAPTITALSPLSGPSGTTVTITGTGFTANNIVHFAIGGISNIPSVNNGTSLTFTVPATIGPYCKPGQACALYLAILNAGTYPVSVENENGTSTSLDFTVTGNATAIPVAQ